MFTLWIIIESMQSASKNEEIPQLTDAFHKARKMYVLFSGILLIWEFMGIRLTNLENTQEASKVTVLSNELVVNAPNGAPVALILLIVYFGMRLVVEWHQSNALRRGMLASRADLWGSHFIAILAISVFTYQNIANQYIFERSDTDFTSLLVGFFFTFIGMSSSLISRFKWLPGRTFRSDLKHYPTSMKIALLIIFILAVILLILSIPILIDALKNDTIRITNFTFIIGFTLAFLLHWAIDLVALRSRKAKPSRI